MQAFLILSLSALALGSLVPKLTTPAAPLTVPAAITKPKATPLVLCPDAKSMFDCNIDCIKHHKTKRGVCVSDDWCLCKDDYDEPITSDKGPALGNYTNFNSLPKSPLTTLIMNQICISDCNCIHNQESGYCEAPWSEEGGSPFCICTGGPSKGCRDDLRIELEGLVKTLGECIIKNTPA